MASHYSQRTLVNIPIAHNNGTATLLTDRARYCSLIRRTVASGTPWREGTDSSEKAIDDCKVGAPHKPFIARMILTELFISVWRPLHGPNDDYPLALCDLATVDQQQDLEIADYVTPKLNREHCLLYENEKHRWW